MEKIDNIRKILLRSPNWIGDAVMSLPATSALKELYPEAAITVLTKPWTAPVYLNNPAISDVITYDTAGEHKGLLGKLRLAGVIKKRGFDMAVLFQNAFEAAFLARLGRVPERVGFARDMRTMLLTVPVELPPSLKGEHEALHYLHLVEAIGGVVPSRVTPKIYVTDKEREWAREFLSKEGFSVDSRTLIGIFPGASFGPAKRWSTENFRGVIEGLSTEQYGSPVPIVFGVGEDSEAASAILKDLKIDSLDLTGRFGLREFFALATQLKLFISNDSGPMHAAAALGVPTVAVFGSTDPSRTAPLGEDVRVVQNKIDCAPCFKRECPYGHYECLETVRVEDVLNASIPYLTKSAKKAAGGGV